MRETAGLPAADRAAKTLERLCTNSVAAVGAFGAAVARWNQDTQRLELHNPDESLLPCDTPIHDQTAVQRAWEHRQRKIVRAVDMSEQAGDLQRATNAEMLLLAPIATLERAWGVLMVFLRRGSLFPEDDLDLINLMAEQSAIALEYSALLDQLQRRTQQLEAANREMEAFSYSVSHDLRAPLRAMDGFSLELLNNFADALPERGQHFLRRIRHNATRMGILIDSLLTLSRLNRQPMKRDLIEPAAIVQEALEEVRGDAATSKAQIVVQDNIPSLHGDPQLLKQVYINLLSNALKFSQNVDAPRIEIGSQQQNGKRVYYVKDNGVGFDMAYADKLFGVFQQLHSPSEFEGTGVGLATVQRIIHRHGGQVWAEAKPNQGATFFFTLEEQPDGSPEH